MAQYDGSIRINTKIDTKGFEDGEKKIEEESRRAAKTVSSSVESMEKEIESLEKGTWKMAQEITSLTLKMNELRELKIPTQEYKEVQNQIESTEKNIIDLIARQEKFLATGGKESSSVYKRMQYDLEELQNSLPFMKGELQDLVDTGKAFTLGVDTNEYANTSNRIEDLTQKISNNRQKVSQIQSEIQAKLQEEVAEEERLAQIRENAVVGNQRIVETVERIKQLEQEIADLKKVNRTEGYEDYDNRIRELASLKKEVKDYNTNIKQTQKSYSRLGQVAKKAFSVANSAISQLNKSAKKSGGLFSNIASRFKGLALSLLIFNQISKAFNAMISGMREGFKNLYNEVGSFKTAVDGMKASALTLKNSFAAAFRPLVDIAIPYIQKTIDALASLMDTVGQITAAITGQKTYTKAIKQTTAAIKDQGKAQNKQLSSLDKLNNLMSSKESSSDYGAGTGTMFEEEVLIPQKSLDISQWIKDMWGKSDFTELGASLGERIKNGLDNINWNEIKEKGQNAAKSLATLINGFVQTEGLPESIGETIGNAINTGVSTAKTFFEETEFYELGESVAKTANTAMETTNWEELAETISLGIESALDMAIGFLDEFDWEEFTESMEEFLAGIDWGGIFGRLGLLLLELLRGAFTIGNKLGTDMTKSLADFFRGIGWDSVAGFFDGLSENIQKHGERVKLMFQYVIDWVKEKLGIHSPSTVFANIGQNVVQGLMNGLAGLKEKVLKIFNSVKNAVKTPINMILGFVESLANGIIRAINFAIGALNNLSITVPDWLKYIPGLSDIAGKTFGFNIPELKQVSIPRLATGTVVPPNREFMAVLGDNKREPEVVSPVSTIEQAVENVLRRSGGTDNDKEITLNLTVECEGYQLIRILQKLNTEYSKQNGGKGILT